MLTNEDYAKVQQQIRTFSESVLFTIGYEGISLEKYINKLIINGICVLCDVRKNAFSQKYGFSKRQLETACKGVDIKYIHIPALGIESEYRQDLMLQKDYDILFEKYENTILQNNPTALQQIFDILNDNRRVALTCFEKNPQQCHRSRIAKKMITFEGKNYTLKEL